MVNINDLSQVYWIGGSPCAGKSSVAHLLRQQNAWQGYTCDDYFEAHSKQATSTSEPVFTRLTCLTGNDLWMRPVDQQVIDELELYREEFPMILSDLKALAPTPPILAEGAALSPECVAGVAPQQEHAIWIVPEPEFQRSHYRQRDWAWDIVNQCTDPTQAFANWMERDIYFARIVAAQAHQRGLPVIYVDGTQSVEEIAENVATHFAKSGEITALY